MPPSKKFQRDDIIKIACEIVKNEGLSDLNARRIAEELNCSTQPIYHNFSSMEELKEKVVEKIYCLYVSYMQEGEKEKRAYLEMGKSYIRFARDYPNYFKILFMAKSGLSPDDFIWNDSMGNSILQKGRSFSGLTEEEQKKFHLKVWIFTHGIATLAALETVEFTDSEIETLLAETAREILAGFKYTKKQEDI